MSDTTPEGAIGVLNGLYYKIGIHNKAFFWDDSEWVKSGKSAVEVERAIDNKRCKLAVD